MRSRYPVSSLLAILAATLFSAGGWGAQAESISLAGTWRFQLDPAKAGIEARWFERALPNRLDLPGTLPAQGIGDAVSVETKWIGGIVDQSWFLEPQYAQYRQPGNVKVPFWLQPEKYYAGAAWYQRNFTIPTRWKGKRIVLFLERPHWETRVWVDGKEIGSNNGLSTPHEYDLGTDLAPGKHQLTLRVDNSLVLDVGVNSHCISDHTQGNWNGVVGNIELRATSPFWLDELQVYPNLKERNLRVDGFLGASPGSKGTDASFVFELKDLHTGQELRLTDAEHDYSVTLEQSPKPGFRAVLPLRNLTNTWDEFSPRLYRLTVQMLAGGGKGGRVMDSRSTTFGLREISTQGTQLALNGRKTFIRGTLECCIFPLTGHPPTDVDSWKRIIRIARDHGLNLIRFHSYCPPEAAFVAADELGFYYQVETCWANQSTTIGDGKPVDQWVYAETDRILKAYGNHPSFLLMPHGNEPGGKHHTEYLAKWVAHYKALDPRRLWSSGAGWPQLPENQFHLTPDPRIQSWGGGLKSRINSKPPETTTDYREYIQKRTVPVISHEIGQWCVYPNFDEIPKYRGYLKPKNFEIFRDSLRAHGMGGQAREFLLASGKLQTLCYKEDIESALRTPGMGGFQLLDLHDFPGQGTALVGVLDPFWDSKGYVTAAEYRRFCNSTVPLARFSKRVFTSDEKLEADIEVAHFGPAPMQNAEATWKLVGDNGKVAASGKLPARDLAVDNGIALGGVSIHLGDVPAPARYKLVVKVGQVSGASDALPQSFENDWDIWVYPPKVDTQPAPAVAVVEELDDRAVAALNSGGKALLLIPPSRVKGDKLGKVGLGFSSIFWNTAWTHRQLPHTLGILCDPKHPALAEFPTDYHSNWQWWYLISRAGAMLLDGLPKELRPTVQVIDDWVTNRKLGLVFEAKVGQGKLVVCSIDLRREQEQNPVAQQLLHSLLAYMAGPKFKPAVALTAAQIEGLMTQATAGQNRGARILKADSFHPGYEPENAIDGDPATLWHTSWEEPEPGFPHELQIVFEKPLPVRGFAILPRQDGNPNGWIKEYEFYISADGRNWGTPVAKGTFSAEQKRKQVMLASPVEARFVRLVALSGHANGPWSSLAEFEIVQ